MKDAVIVGAGPAGCFLGKKLSERGYEIVIVEEHSEIGQPSCCAGIVGAEGLKEVGLDPRDWSLNELSKGAFYSPFGELVTLSRGEVEAHTIDRAKFDRDLAEEAVRSGAEINLDTKCIDVSRDDDKVEVKIENQGSRNTVESRMVIGADGPSSIVARKMDLIENFSPIVGSQAEIVKDKESDTAEVYFGNDLSRNYFGWIVPAGDVYRVGLIDRKQNVRKKLMRFIENKETLPKNSKRKIINLTSGQIPSAGTRKIYGDRVILVGDAAGHVKPLTGGGLYIGLSCVQIASNILEKALEDEPRENNLEKYNEKVEKKFAREFQLGNRAQEIFQNMTDEDISDLLELLKNTEFRNVVLEDGEFDRHSRLFESIIEEGPSIAGSIGPRRFAKYMKMLADSWRKSLGLF